MQNVQRDNSVKCHRKHFIGFEMEIQWLMPNKELREADKNCIEWDEKTYSPHHKDYPNLLFISISYKQKQINLFELDLIAYFTWNRLFFSSFSFPVFELLFCRNRLESNSEHWNALLLSLRELTEWVIRKDTELSQLRSGPLRGDAASLQKQLVSFSILKVFRMFFWKIEFIKRLIILNYFVWI